MNAKRPPVSQTSSPDIKWIERLAYLLDEQFRFPGTKFRFGLDPVMNLIPFLGDISGFIISAALVMAVARNGASSKLVVRMSVNILLDATIGIIPVIGQIFDFYYKANKRNITLLKEHYMEGKHQGSGRNLLLVILAILFILVVLIIYAIWQLFAAIFGMLV